jgi:hypothetical protein
MGNNPHWFDQVRARGICYICRRPMHDDDPRRRHTECEYEAHHGRTYAQIRNHPPPLRAQVQSTDVDAARPASRRDQ